MPCIGILALQGGYEAHQKKIQSLGFQCRLVRNLASLEKVDALILPGGESTTMTYLLEKYYLWDFLKKKVIDIPILATCAGVILLQKLGALDVDIIRNGYGRQLDSGIFPLTATIAHKPVTLNGFFIRAPVITKIHDPAIEILSYHQKDPVLLGKNNIIAATFHPELSESVVIHQHFTTLLSNSFLL